MLERIQQLATGRNVIWALVAYLIAFGVINIAATQFYNSTGGYGILDLGGGANVLNDAGSYTPEKAYTIINHYGVSGIHHYYGILVIDIFFPLSLGGFTLLAILWSLRRITPRWQWLYLLALVPPAYTLVDWSENLCILTMLLNYPEQLPHAAALTDFIKGVKNLLGAGSFVLVIVTRVLAIRSNTTAWRDKQKGRESLE